MIDPASLAKSIESASKVANTPLFTTVIDKVTGFRLSKWAAEGEVRKKLIHDEYEKAKENGIMGMQYIEYMRNTQNLIDIAVKSSKFIDSAKPNDIKIDNDFFWNTIDYAKTVSNEQVQDLIAKIMAGEFNNPGTYNISILQILKMLSKEQLDLFERIGSLVINAYEIPSKFFEVNDSTLRKSLDIKFSNLQELQLLGLIYPNTASRIKDIEKETSFYLKYFDKKISYEPIHDKGLKVEFPPNYHLSNAGKLIIQHLDSQYNDLYFNWLRINYEIENYRVI